MPGDAGHASHTLSRPKKKKLARTGVYKPFIKLDKSKSSSSTAALGKTAEEKWIQGVCVSVQRLDEWLLPSESWSRKRQHFCPQTLKNHVELK